VGSSYRYLQKLDFTKKLARDELTFSSGVLVTEKKRFIRWTPEFARGNCSAQPRKKIPTNHLCTSHVAILTHFDKQFRTV
jgi:hypothetical protein